MSKKRSHREVLAPLVREINKTLQDIFWSGVWWSYIPPEKHPASKYTLLQNGKVMQDNLTLAEAVCWLKAVSLTLIQSTMRPSFDTTRDMLIPRKKMIEDAAGGQYFGQVCSDDRLCFFASLIHRAARAGFINVLLADVDWLDKFHSAEEREWHDFVRNYDENH